jgi:hypothetical protein
MRVYSDDDERIIRVKRLADQWMRSGLISVAQHEQMTAGLRIDLRRTNQFLHLTLFGFGLLIIASSVGLVLEIFGVSHPTPFGSVCLASGVVSAGAAEFLVLRFRVYRFGIEEACAACAVVLAAVGTAVIAGQIFGEPPADRLLIVGLVTASAAALAVYRRFGYVYTGVAAMLCASVAPFPLHLAASVHRLLAAAVLSTCFIAARAARRRHGDEFPGDEYGTLQAAAWIGIYAVLNLQLWSRYVAPQSGPFYWFTYATIWALPVAGLWLSIRDRDRPLLDTSLVMAFGTLLTNKPYLGLARKPWDPVLLGLLLMGTAGVMRRWLAGGDGRSRNGFTATRLLRSDKDMLAVAGIASVAAPQIAAHSRAPSPSPDRTAPDPFQGGRSGGAGGGASF